MALKRRDIGEKKTKYCREMAEIGSEREKGRTWLEVKLVFGYNAPSLVRTLPLKTRR